MRTVKKMRILLALGLACLLSCNDHQGKKDLLVTAVLPLTGDVAAYGKDSRDGIDLAVELANANQKEYKFSVDYHDSKGDARTSVTALERAFATTNPIAIVGENISSSTGAMIPVADRHKTLLISPSASAPNLSGTSPYFFRVFPSDDAEGTFMADQMARRNPGAGVCVIYVNNDYGVGLKDVFEKKAKQVNLKLAGSFGYDKGQMDFKTLLVKVKSLAPSAIYIPSYYQDGATLLKQARELGIDAQFYGATTHEDPKFLEIAGKAAEGFIYPLATGFDAASTDSVVRQFIAAFTKKYGKSPGLVSALGYDCAQMIIRGTLQNGPSSDGIRTFLLQSKDIHGAAGVMNFDKDGNVHKPIMLKTVRNGQFVTL